MVTVNAKVFTAAGRRVLLQLVCPSRRQADRIIRRAYPDHRAAFLMVDRTGEAATC